MTEYSVHNVVSSPGLPMFLHAHDENQEGLIDLIITYLPPFLPWPGNAYLPAHVIDGNLLIIAMAAIHYVGRYVCVAMPFKPWQKWWQIHKAIHNVCERENHYHLGEIHVLQFVYLYC